MMKQNFVIFLLFFGLLFVSCDMSKQTRKTPSEKPQKRVATASSEEKDTSPKNVSTFFQETTSPQTLSETLSPSSPTTKKKSFPFPLPSLVIGKIKPETIVLSATGLALSIHFLLKLLTK